MTINIPDGTQSKGDATQGAPRPLLLTKARTGGAKPKKILATKSAIPSTRGTVEVTVSYENILPAGLFPSYAK